MSLTISSIESAEKKPEPDPTLLDYRKKRRKWSKAKAVYWYVENAVFFLALLWLFDLVGVASWG